MLRGEGVCKLDNLFPIRLLYIMQINMFKLNQQMGCQCYNFQHNTKSGILKDA